MRAIAKAMNDFVGGFGYPAYTTQTVPKDVQVPYLTYPLTEPEWNQKATWYIQGWFKTTSNALLAEVADRIISEIGTGITISTESGFLVIYPETPIVQMLVEGDYRSFYINLSINCYQMPGAYPENTQVPGNVPEEGE